MPKIRLDALLFERGLAESRERAKTAVMSGSVFVNGQRVDKPGTQVPEDSEIEVKSGAVPYVSRGGLKLQKALDEFTVSPANKICLDCGASTGGFTDCLLQRGAGKVYAVDVGYGQLAWSVRSDPRVITMERTNIRYVTREQISEEIDLAVIDVSFISLKLVLPAVKPLLKPEGEVICLIKPQFEAGREKVGKKGVVRDKTTHKEVLNNFIENAGACGFSIKNMSFSPIKGPEGNIEYLALLSACGESGEHIDTESLVDISHERMAGPL